MWTNCDVSFVASFEYGKIVSNEKDALAGSYEIWIARNWQEQKLGMRKKGEVITPA